jgi:hypothetical protein
VQVRDERAAPPFVHQLDADEAVLRRPDEVFVELAAASGVSRAIVYQLLKTLTERGELVRRELPGGVAGYAVPAEPSAFDAPASAEVRVAAAVAGARPERRSRAD